jgi:hypothetical protein
MSVAALLASLLPEIVSADRRLVGLTWKLNGSLAIANVDELGDTHRVGTELHVTMAPDILSIIEYLRTEGWKRDSFPASLPGWNLFTFKRTTDADGNALQVTISGHYFGDRPDGIRNDAIPFFAPEPPPIGVGRGWKDRYFAWDHKCKQSEW